MKIMTEEQAKKYKELAEKIIEILKDLEPCEKFFVLETAKQVYLTAHSMDVFIRLLEK